MRKLLLIIAVISCIAINGCAKEATPKKQNKSAKIFVSAKNQALLNQSQFEVLPTNEYDSDDKKFKVKDDLEAAKVMSYMMSNEKNAFLYESEKEIDINRIAQIISCIYPYDISLSQDKTDFTSGTATKLYTAKKLIFHPAEKNAKQAIKKATKISASIIKEGMDNNDKIKAIHNYLIQNCVYDLAETTSSQRNERAYQAIGVFQDKKAVCAGYAKAFMMIAEAADLPAILVVSEKINHAWNLVYGNNGWRYVDTTWDDPIPDDPSKMEDQFLNKGIYAFLDEKVHDFDPDKPSEYYLDIANAFYNLPTFDF